jgi:phytanoyl-CoA hydroxylase
MAIYSWLGREPIFKPRAKDMAKLKFVFSFESVSNEAIAFYRENGFVGISGLLPRDEALEWREAALAASERLRAYSDQPVFTQTVNVWQQDARMRELTLDPRLASAATTLAGIGLRLWHDQILIKQPHNQTPTEFHQDQPYWPHLDSPNPISVWLSLGDASVESGCMTFLPGSHLRTNLPAQNLGDADSLFEICAELAWGPRVTLPLRAGDCTFHHGRCAHMAGPNTTESPRVAHVVIYMDAAARFSGARHVVTDPLGIDVGGTFDHPLFPAV